MQKDSAHSLVDARNDVSCVNAFKALGFFAVITFNFLLKDASVGWFWLVHNGREFHILD